MGVKKTIKRALFKLITSRVKPVHQNSINELNKILIIRQDNRIGNVLFITSLIELIKNTTNISPDTIVGEKFHSLLENNPNVNCIFIFRQKQFLRRPWKFFQFLRQIRATHYDLVIDCKDSFSFNNALLTLKTNAKVKIGFHNEYSERYLNFALDLKNNDSMHESIYLAQPLIQYLQLKYDVPPMHYYFSDSKSTVKKNPALILVGIHIGGRRDKAICPDLVNKICKAVSSNKNILVLIIYGPDEIQKAKKIENCDNLIKLFPKSMDELSQAIYSTDLFITPDTGPLHIASALNKSIIALFNVENSIRYGPRSDLPSSVINTTKHSQAEIVNTVQSYLLSLDNNTYSQEHALSHV